jgi:hypothetical protein
MIVYHGTAGSLRSKIEREGLRPRNGCGPYVSESRMAACTFAWIAASDEDVAEGLVLEIKLPRRSLRTHWIRGRGYFEVPGGVPPERIIGWELRPVPVHLDSKLCCGADDEEDGGRVYDEVFGRGKPDGSRIARRILLGFPDEEAEG